VASLNFKDVYINNSYSVAGMNETNGNLKNINATINDYLYGEKTFEDAEIKMQKITLNNLITQNKIPDVLVGGELSNQLSTTRIQCHCRSTSCNYCHWIQENNRKRIYNSKHTFWSTNSQ